MQRKIVIPVLVNAERLCYPLLAIAILLTLAGCSATGERFTERPAPAGKALIYVYRKSSAFGAAGSWELFSNERYVARIDNGGYYDYVVDPGHIEYKFLTDINPIMFIDFTLNRLLREKEPVCAFDAQPDHVYFFKCSLGATMAEVPRDKALKALADLRRYPDPTSVPK